MRELVFAVLILPGFLAAPLRSVAIFHMPGPVAHETLQTDFLLLGSFFVNHGDEFLTLLIACRDPPSMGLK